MRTGLGRGLDVLLGQPASASAPTMPPASAGATEIPLEKILPNPRQPRTSFPADELEQLAASIKRHGVLQPIVVSRSPAGFELVAGHRRVLASRIAGKSTIPAVVREDVGDRLELALIENVQRADLNPIEEARAYRLLMETYGLTQDEVAERMGRSRPAVANTLRLLGGPQILQDAVIDGIISEAHLRALLPLSAPAQLNAYNVITTRRLSAHATEDLVRRLLKGKKTHDGGRSARVVDPEMKARTADLRAALGTKVEIQRGRKGGRISIEFYSNDDFERLYERLTGAAK